MTRPSWPSSGEEPAWCYATLLYMDSRATLKDLHKAVTTLEETAPIARRVLGSSHPLALSIENYRQDVHETLRARKCAREASRA